MSPLTRERTESGRERRKRNDTMVGTLQDKYGERLAPQFSIRMELGTLKERIGLSLEDSLDDVLRHYGIRK
jgi:hypothetical protein